MLSFFATAPIVMAVFIYALPLKKAGKAIAFAAQAVLAACSFYLFYLCKRGEIISSIGNYGGSMGIILRADAFSSVFIALASFIFLIITLYIYSEDVSRLLWFFLFIWQGLLNGIFLTRDVFNVFILVEAVTVVVAAAIMFYRDNRSMYDGMLYFMVNTVAAQFYLLGVGYIYKLTGTLDMDAISAAISDFNAFGIDKSPLILPFALIMVALCLKCAQAPLFGWLPKAHGTPSAPTVVSAILSGLHIKGALYLFIRFREIFHEIMIHEFFLAVGVITGIAGFVFALAQSDIKLILAYHTVSQAGMIMIGLSQSDYYSYSYTGSIYHIINHALFKSALFLGAGVIAQAYGTRDIYKIRGVLKRLPLAGVAIAMAVLGITGAPFFNGSVSKYFIMTSAGWAVNAALVIINLGTIISFIKFSSMLFGDPAPGQPAMNVDADTQASVKIDAGKQAAMLILGILCFLGGIFGEQFIWFLFGINVSISADGYLQKVILFILSGSSGFLLYKYYIKGNKLLIQIKEAEIGFRGICVLMGAFFATLLIVGKIFINS